MSVVRRYVVLVVGVLIFALGVIGLLTQPVPTASFGWTAYAPLTSTTYTPSVAPVLPWISLIVGAILIAGWVGFQIGRRRGGSSSEGLTASQ